MKDLFKWNPHADLTDFTFLDDKFVEMCRNRDPVCGGDNVIILKCYPDSMNYRKLKISFESCPCAILFYLKKKMVCFF